MKRHEKQMVEQILNLWLSYRDKVSREAGIIGSGPTISGKTFDYRGSMPDPGAYRPEVISDKAEKLRDVFVTTDERIANNAVMLLSEVERLIITRWPERKNRHNSSTGQGWRQTDIALVLFDSLEAYLKALELIGLKLTTAWRRLGGRVDI